METSLKASKEYLRIDIIEGDKTIIVNLTNLGYAICNHHIVGDAEFNPSTTKALLKWAKAAGATKAGNRWDFSCISSGTDINAVLQILSR